MTARDNQTRFNDLPVAGLDEITGGAKVMILAPHPDDETLGCGGLIAELCARNRPPTIVVLSDGTGSHPSSPSFPSDRLRGIRQDEVKKALTILGLPLSQLYLLDLPDTKLNLSYDVAIAKIRNIVVDERCEIICTTWRHDPHADHEAAYFIARAVMRATSAQLLCYPVWGRLLPDTAPVPERLDGWRLDISRYAAVKKRAIAAHVSQYGNLINDDPNGFRLPRRLLSIFDAPYEVFIASS